MKIIVRIIFLSLFALPAIAQKPMHQIGMSASLLTPYFSYNTANGYITNMPKNLLGRMQYKLQINTLQLRSSFGYGKQKINNTIGEEGSTYQSSQYGYINSFEGTLGIEKKFGSKKLKPYIAGDIFFLQNKGLVDYYFNGCFGMEDGEWKINTKTYGIRAIGGLSYQLNSMLSCHIEVSISYAQNRAGQSNFYNYTSNKFGINPVQNLGIMYTFR
jgi:hypothetical protein